MLFVTISSQAQYASEEELKIAANDMFEKADYSGSIKLFGQLLSNYPKDPSYNYKYGACVLFGSRDKEKSLKYLKFAITKPNLDPVAYYFLAKAFHYNYEFAPAIVNYNKFKSKVTPKLLQTYKVDRDIKMCENGQQLIKSMADIGVLSKKEIKETDFFRSYKLNGIGGKIIVKPDDFKTKFDLKNNEKSVIYLGEKKDMVVYSSYGKTGSTGKDIYRVVKLPSGEWSKPTPLSDVLNTEFDEDYPFLHPDGRTLYFSSKGFNSMGGYDIFKSTKDASGQWSFPENLDFPINTPGDDILYISDIDNKLAYFASSRASKQGELTVYNVKVKSTPSQHSIIKGFFLAESNPSMKSATITVKDAENDRRYGVYKTHDVSGEYLLTFPSNGGKFKILVETTSDASVHAAVIELPPLDGFRALKQELRLVGVGDDEKLVVKNLFDESDVFDMSDPLVVQNLLKQKAKLDVNTTVDEISKSVVSAEVDETENKSVYSDLSDDQIVNKTDETSSKIIDQTTASKEQANASYQLANLKSAQAKEIYNEAKTLSDNGEIEKAESKKLEAAKLINEVVAAIAMAKTLDNEVVERESDIAKVKSLQETVNTNIDQGNRAEAEENLAALDEIASATYHNESALEIEEEILSNDLSEKQRVYNKDRDAVTELKNREFELTESISNLESQVESTKKKNEKADLESRIEALKIDAEDVEFDLDRAKGKAALSVVAFKDAKSKAESTKQVVATINEGSAAVTPVEASTKLQLENDIVYFEKEGLVGLYPTESETLVSSSEIYSIEEHKNEFEIVNDEGEIVDYNTKYGSELADVGNDIDEEKRAGIIMKINESWIRDINEELVIRNKQLESETELGEKISLQEKIEVLETLKLEKQKEYIEYEELMASEGLSTTVTTNAVKDNSSTETTSSEIVENKEDVKIMNTDGSIIDYGSKYTSKLEVIGDKDDFATYSKKSKIHKNWASATEQEILIKKMELVEAESTDKNSIENEIAVLESNLLEQEEFAALYKMQAESMDVEGVLANTETEGVNNEENIANNNESSSTSEEQVSSTEEGVDVEETINTEEPSTNNVESETESSSEVPSNNTNEITSEVINEVYEGDDYKENYSAKLNAIGEEESYETTMQKNTIHKNWGTTIELEIAKKKAVMTSLSDDQKNGIANEIAILESDLTEQQEFASLYEAQAETMEPSESITSEEPLVSTEGAVSSEEAVGTEELVVEEGVNTNEESTSSNTESTVSNKLLDEDLTENNLNSPADDYSNLKYNNSFNYTSTQSKTALSPVVVLKEEAKALKEEAETKMIAANEISSEEEKVTAVAVANDLTEQYQRKQEQIAKVYENANRNEYYNNQALISKLLADNGEPNSNEVVRSELFTEESDNFYDKAKVKREEASDASSFATKERILQDAYELEMKAIEKQIMAMNALSSGSQPEPIAIVGSIPEINEVETNLETSEETKSVEEAGTTNEETAFTSEETAQENSVSNETVQPIIASSSEISTEDQETLLNLKTAEITAIVSSEEYLEYTELKASKRRLVKEAEVEYVEAQKVEQDAKDQEQLGVSLKAMAAGASTEEDKAKKLAQIEKLEKMIADNKTKSNELKESAANKEVKAKEAEDKSNFILINADEKDAKSFTVIEKAETFDKEFLAKVMGRTTSVPVTEEPLALTEETESSTEELPTVNEEIAIEEEVSVEEPIIEEEVASSEGVISNKETVVNNNEESNNEEPTTEESVVNEVQPEENNTEPIVEEPIINNEEIETSNSTPEDIDIIPSILSESIFVINNNTAAYSDNKRIPVSSKLPEGLVFKVQIGAFRNPIPQDHFRGFAPILAENAGNGITRYTAGLFQSFNVANEAKRMIRDIGYNDAFVVGFFNGKRISMTEARAMLNEGIVTEEALAINATPEVNNEEANTSTRDESIEEEVEVEPNLTEEVKDGVSTDVRNIEGAFYAIQVGVYSKQVTAGQLNNVSPLNSERTSGGLIRYTSGVFKTLADANVAKDRIRGLGITDAFVVAYKGGKKVTVAEVSSSLEVNTIPEKPIEEVVSKVDSPKDPILNEGTEIVTSEEDKTLEETPNEESKVDLIPEEINTSEETPKEEAAVEERTEISEVTEGLNLNFKVKLGEYSEDVPVDEAGLFLKLNGRGVENHEEGNNTVYTIGSFPDYQSALDVQIEMKEMGVKNPQTIAFQNDQPIELEKALELIKNNQ